MYQRTQTDSVIRLADGALIPADQGNTDYLAYLEWVEEGNVAEAAPEAPIGPAVPAAVTPRQARLALLHAGRLADVAAAIEALAEPQRTAAQIEWEFASSVERASPLVATLGAALALAKADLDALFVAAGGM
ncbi:hypothetical protein GT347_20365 [Xylophilus rhododendri]|uniref:Uncharacterized protein n=1 Tax=Xylophilus rhododendri TaxID=2697032 RepID=A0A857J8D7_9BURK|nr:hypothetical protein [Xylophilus rhododendri]QHJ00127.1 hypothetical protein GT347_20365 [Xylophilus rhododendri]